MLGDDENYHHSGCMNMRILVSIDDTDNLDSRGTGEIASLIAEGMQQNGWGPTSMVTRHQLLVHPDIPYTSHNSAMCFEAEIGEDDLQRVVAFAGAFLDCECAPGSDPGLCVAVVDRIASADELIAFGRRAKLEVIAMPEAFELAQRLGAHLSPHGGTGQGVIGALAGAGLRLWGNDGRMKGCLEVGPAGSLLRVRELLEHPLVQAVRCVDGGIVAAEDLVEIGEKPKTVMCDGASVLLLSAVDSDGGEASWRTLPRKLLRGY
jgi:hypothetical protein